MSWDSEASQKPGQQLQIYLEYREYNDFAYTGLQAKKRRKH